MLELRDLSVSYGPVGALHNIDITVEKGELVTILGANGAGKSTTLMAISGLVPPSGGSANRNPAAPTTFYFPKTHPHPRVFFVS